jgi:prepilin signal peptidase PulO-like enzyme (type II secretory pathway)
MFWEMLLVIAVYDIRHKIIPDGFVILVSMLGVLRMCMAFFAFTHGGVEIPVFDMSFAWGWNVGAGMMLALPFALLWFFSGGRWMGLGDAKLAFAFGSAFGLACGLTGIIFGFWVGALLSIPLLLFRGRSFTMKSELPFAPFLVLGMLIAYTFGINILHWVF